MKVCILIIAVLAFTCAPSLLQAEQCGTQGGNKACPGGLCCSKWGWCGKTKEYCSELLGCQNNCRCGGEWDNARCNTGRCCSIWGWCGSSTNNCCRPYCQSDCKNCAPAPGELLALGSQNMTGVVNIKAMVDGE